ncbi:RNA-binding S4 domain-containing protein [Ancylobacter terrae]|uniref:RNA-binding S4 domain-containing protein n=1 Tax=Ancylobacter sp. sgz301288 TaxID=3342077 RepID=UPI00385DBA9E
MTDAPNDRQRLDIWLWHARCARTRTAAAGLVRDGRIRLNGTRVTAPAQPVRRGDVITAALPGGVRVLRIEGFAERRGDATAAKSLMSELNSPPAPGDELN